MYPGLVIVILTRIDKHTVLSVSCIRGWVMYPMLVIVILTRIDKHTVLSVSCIRGWVMYPMLVLDSRPNRPLIGSTIII